VAQNTSSRLSIRTIFGEAPLSSTARVAFVIAANIIITVNCTFSKRTPGAVSSIVANAFLPRVPIRRTSTSPSSSDAIEYSASEISVRSILASTNASTTPFTIGSNG
jgi:hypothetical protein